MPSLEEAIDEKYGGDLFECHSSESFTIYIPKKNPRKIIPSLLVLNDCGIDTAGSENLSLKCCDVTELDLAQNKLKEWTEILEILRHMPHLKFVNLSFNDLSNEMTKFDTQCNNYVYLKFLVLNSTHTPWSTVRKLLKSLPNLEELHLCFNEYHEVGLCENCDIHREKHEKKMIHHERVKRLHFTGNPIHTWREISKLGESFPLLEALVLTECPIKNLDPFWSEESEAKSNHEMEVSKASSELENENESHVNYRRTDSECESNQKNISAHHFFRYLKFLNLNFTLLSSWDEIDRLGKFPQLQSLRIQGCPLFEANQYTEHERRQLLIARLANIQTLNGGGAINAEEREDAERAFIRYYMEKPESDRPERYTDLINIHGKLDPLVNIDLTPEKRVTVMIVYKDLSEKRSLNVYQTVSELKQKLDGFAGIPARKMKLFYLDQDMKGVMGPEEMRYPNKQLYSYNICNGDEILVDEKMATFKSSS